MDSRDKITQKYFNQDIELISNGITKYGEFDITKQFAALITGAPDGSKISLDGGEDGLIFNIVNDSWFSDECTRCIDLRNAYPVLYNLSLTIKSPKLGLGKRILAHQVATARQLGFGYVVVPNAGGGQAADGSNFQFNGNYTWARLGFDFNMDLDYERYQILADSVLLSPEKEWPQSKIDLALWRKNMPEQLRGQNFSSVLELFEIETGRTWFRSYPVGLKNMTFELDKNSRSSAVHSAYLNNSNDPVNINFSRYSW